MKMLNLFLSLQTNVTEQINTVAQQGAEEMKMPFFELAQKGGLIMIPIILLSIIAVYIFFERFHATTKAGKVDVNFMNKIKDYIYEEKIESAVALCQSNQNPVGRMVEKGVQRIGRPLNDINTAIENMGKLEVSKLEKGLPLLATVAGGAPMIGFLGTVMGMVRAFYDMSVAGNNIDISKLSNGIYTALITTVAGLIVGIVAFFAYNILVARVEKVVNKLETTITEFMDLLNEPVKMK